MVPRTDLSLQDYFRLAGIGASPLATRSLSGSLSGREGMDFAQLLDCVQEKVKPDTSAVSKGMRLEDYFENRIQAQTQRYNLRPSTSGPEMNKVTHNKRVVSYQQAQLSAVTNEKSSYHPSFAVHQNQAESIDRSIESGIEKAAAKYHLSSALIRSVIQAESNFNPNAVSPAGAQGLMQLMPATAKDLGMTDSFDIEQNIDGGARYLRQMLDKFDGDLKKAIAAYNAGPGTVMKYNGNVPYRETRNYVQKVLAYSKQYGGANSIS